MPSPSFDTDKVLYLWLELDGFKSLLFPAGNEARLPKIEVQGEILGAFHRPKFPKLEF